MFSSKSFIVAGLIFRSLIHFEFIFVYGARECWNFILLHVPVQFSQHHLLKRLSFLHCIFLPPLSKIRWPYVRGFISGLSLLFHVSIFLFLCQYYIVLITVCFVVSFEIGKCESSNFVHLFQDCFGYSGFLIFPCEFENWLVNFYKQFSWDLNRNCIKYV